MGDLAEIVSNFKDMAVAIRSATCYASGIRPIDMASRLRSAIDAQGFGESMATECAKLLDAMQTRAGDSYGIITKLGQSAMQNRPALVSASFPLCRTVGSGAFWSCAALTSVYIPECVSIGENAFLSCAALRSLYLPKAESIGPTAFRSCCNLVSLYVFSPAVCQLGASAFWSTPIGGYSTSAKQFGSVYVRPSLVEAFKAATNWALISSRIVGMATDPVTGQTYS